MEELTVSTGDAEVIVDVSSGDVEILEDTTRDVLQEDYTETVDPAESETLVDMSGVVAAVQSLERSIEQGILAICILLGCIVGILLVKGFWTGKD